MMGEEEEETIARKKQRPQCIQQEDEQEQAATSHTGDVSEEQGSGHPTFPHQRRRQGRNLGLTP